VISTATRATTASSSDAGSMASRCIPVLSGPRRDEGHRRASPSTPEELLPARRKKPRANARPRVPLPRQTGGVHEDKRKRPFRRRKHRKANLDEG
jgi:hypothetical protein